MQTVDTVALIESNPRRVARRYLVAPLDGYGRRRACYRSAAERCLRLWLPPVNLGSRRRPAGIRSASCAAELKSRCYLPQQVTQLVRAWQQHWHLSR